MFSSIYKFIFPSPSPSYNLYDSQIIIIPTLTHKIPCYFHPFKKNAETKLDPSHNICLYFHGNGEDIGHSGYLLPDFQSRLQMDFLVVEYPGYGHYEAKKSIKAIKQDCLDIYDYLINIFKSENIFVMGRSIGSGPAVYLAANRKIMGLALISPFCSLNLFINEIFDETFKFEDPEEEFDNVQEIKKVNAKIVIIHGLKDKLIKVQHAYELEKAVNNSEKIKTFYPEFMTHNDFDVLLDLLANLKTFFKEIKSGIVMEVEKLE